MPCEGCWKWVYDEKEMVYDNASERWRYLCTDCDRRIAYVSGLLRQQAESGAVQRAFELFGDDASSTDYSTEDEWHGSWHEMRPWAWHEMQLLGLGVWQ